MRMASVDNADKILIPVETKSRELSAKLFLGTILAGRGYDVYLGNKVQHTILEKIDPDIYFELSGKDHAERLRHLKQHGIRTLILETEGSGFSGVEEFSKLMDQETLELVDCYCAWGSIGKKTVKSVAPDTRVEVTGNPRFDLLQEPYRKFYSHNAEQIRDEYDEFILFNTNFTRVAGDKPAEAQYSNYAEGDPERKYISAAHKKEVKIFGEFIRVIAEVAETFNNKNIIVRPHPGGSPSFYNNCFYGYDNVHIERRLEVRPWIMAAEAVVHNSCTTGITSALLDTPVIAYTPDGLEAKSPPNKVSNRCETVTAVRDELDEYLSDNNSFHLSGDKKKIIKKYIDNIEYLSVDKIADVVDSLSPNPRTGLTPDIKLYLRQLLVQTVGPKHFENIWVKKLRGEDRHKFPYTPTANVKSIVNRFVDDFQPEDLQIERLPYIVNGFRLYCSV